MKQRETKTSVRELLRGAGFKASDVARSLGVAESTLSLKLSGARPFRVEEISAIQRLLNAPEALKKLGRRSPILLEELVNAGKAA